MGLSPIVVDRQRLTCNEPGSECGSHTTNTSHSWPSQRIRAYIWVRYWRRDCTWEDQKTNFLISRWVICLGILLSVGFGTFTRKDAQAHGGWAELSAAWAK